MPTIHKNARLTPKLREEIHNSNAATATLARKYNVTDSTIEKWKSRTDFNDKSSCRNKICFTLSQFEEELICETKRLTLFALDDLLELLKGFIPTLTRDNLYLCLKRHKLNRNDLILPEQEVKPKAKEFKDYDIGYLHIDIKYLPKINEERKYLFVAIDRKTRLCIIKIYANQDAISAVDFVSLCNKTFPFKINKILTDNGKCFTDRFAKGRQTPTGNHLFDKICGELEIEHRLTQPYTPKTNGMVERMNGRFKENILDKFIFSTQQELEFTLHEYIYNYNFHIKQKKLEYQSPVTFYEKLIAKNLESEKECNTFEKKLKIFDLNFVSYFQYNHPQLDK